MERTPLAIVGCGGMGRRHLTGLDELARSDFNNVRLIAVCDLNRQNAEDLADEAAQLLGSRPQVFTSIEQLARDVDGLAGADVTVDTGAHHRVATACLDLGLHVQCEKPLALTIRGCDAIIAAAQRAGKVLSVAENYRRDPINRLARALLTDGAIGTPQLLLETSIGGADNLFITPWRHQKMAGTVVLDAGVHYADILQYYLGPVRQLYGEGRLFERLRYRGDTRGPGGFYEKWAASIPETTEATGEDALFGQLRFASGAVAQWVDHHAGHGQPHNQRAVWGSKGSLVSPGDRNGRPVRLFLDGHKELVGAGVLDYAPSYRLEPLAAALFGGERVAHYEFPFPTIDAKILALEYHEFAESIQGKCQPEVTGEVGRAAVAIVYGLLESGVAGRAVTLEEVERSQVDGYAREMDVALGLLP